MFIKGFQKTTLLDYPSKVASTVFTGGCNFRCPFCHNASLVTHIDKDEFITEESVLQYLKKRSGILDGVCITGGEPLLQTDIVDFCKKVRELDLLIKLDTNGSKPKELENLVSLGLVDYVAMDIKNSKELYGQTVGINDFEEGLSRVEQSVDFLMSSGIEYEFRTTVVRQFHYDESIADLCRWITGAKQYYLQSFTDSGDLICDGLSGYNENEMTCLLDVAKNFIPNAKLRGI